jgi:hypothetical protein
MTEQAQIIASTAGRFFAVEFMKKDGTRRAMVARVGVRKGVTGAGLRYNPADYNLVVAWDSAKRQFRMINLDTLISLRCGSLEWKSGAPKTEVEAINELTAALKQLAEANEATASTVATISEPATPSLEEELAALDARQVELSEREKTIGFSRRFASLNSQTIRHKRARIQERQIELRALIAQKALAA